MKISKVDHTRAAVSKQKGRISGILYEDPSRKKNRDLDERMRDLNRKAKVLYNVFNAIDDKEDKKKYGDIVNLVNRSVKSGLIDRNLDADKLVRTMKGSSYDMAVIDELLVLYLRKSLKKEKDGLKEIMKAAFSGGVLSGDAKDEAVAFVKLVIKDYNKTEFGKKVVKSVENQNMLVQPASEGSKVQLTLNRNLTDNNTGDRKRNEKAGFIDFQNEYANLDSNVRLDLLRRLRRLLDVYFATPENGEYISLSDDISGNGFNVWEAHEDGKKNNEDFIASPDAEGIKKDDGKTDRVKLKAFNAELGRRIRERNMYCYRYAMKAVADKNNADIFFASVDTNAFWIHHIEGSVERILAKCTYNSLNKLRVGYLKEKVWKDVLNYISIKYIAIGKAVFNYAMEDIYSIDDEITAGELVDKAVFGFTSFDYEIIKASETLQRELAVQVAFAANNLARATVSIPADEEEDDFLTWKKELIEKNRSSKAEGGTIKAVLQFFGGASSWDMSLFSEGYGSNADVDFLYDLKSMIYSLRNESFHFSTADVGGGDWNQGVINRMFVKDIASYISVEKNKFYSNNLPMFYSEKDLRAVLDHIYRTAVIRQSQVPAFNGVVVRKNLRDFLTNVLQCSPSFKDVEVGAKWQSAVYYLFKEIYYNDFLPSGSSKAMFYEALNQMKNSSEYAEKDKKNAIADFSRRCNELTDMDLPQLCQTIMTEYNYQNQGSMKVKNSRAQSKNPDIFQHYKMLLLITMRNAFGIFIKKSSIYSFLFKPVEREMCSADEFCQGWMSDKYNALIKDIEEDATLQKWYITSRFLNGRSLSLLSGTVKSFIQYVEEVNRRAKQTGNTLIRDDRDKAEYCKKIVQILELSTQLSSVFTNNFDDYFDSREEYAAYLANYLDYGYNEGGESAVHYLDAFCNAGETKYSIYMDGMNPIMNRNVLMAKLFGADSIISKVVDRVSETDLKNFYSQQEKITQYMVKGVCDTKEEQQNVLDFTRLKNHIEFRDVVEYSEIVNELLGQLINWSYMRERDLLYFQLGFHYTCLNTSENLPLLYKEMSTSDGKIIKGAILYQIAAMYIYGIPMYGAADENGVVRISKAPITSAKIGAFCSYTKSVLKDVDYEFKGSEVIYNAGLEVFENINEHDAITDIRNSIDHFKYYSGNAGSILDFYSEVFDRFFTYDMKYSKNVGNILTNILLRHFVNAKLEFVSGEKKIDRSGTVKPRAQIGIAEKGLESEKFTYKIAGTSPYETAARDSRYIETIGRILYYPAEKANLFSELKLKNGNNSGNKGRNGGGNGDGRNVGRDGGNGDGFRHNPNPSRQYKKEAEEGRRRMDDYKKQNPGSAGSVGTSLGDIFKNLGY